jgi:hypothetical protein
LSPVLLILAYFRRDVLICVVAYQNATFSSMRVPRPSAPGAHPKCQLGDND